MQNLIGVFLHFQIGLDTVCPEVHTKAAAVIMTAVFVRTFIIAERRPRRMATVYLKKHHPSKGETIAQSMKDCFDYGQNSEKTVDGELIHTYECDPKTTDEEFTLAKAQYLEITGRKQKEDSDVLCYQIRQSFAPSEVDTQAALKIGYDLAMRWTKGNHAFFVASHIDRPHSHIHIYYNSTALDYTRKFKYFYGSGQALRRLSDRVCIKRDLSVIKKPKLHSKGKFKHSGQ